jgi:hypothetical protein
LKIKKRNLIILNEASHLPFFAQLAGRPMTEDPPQRGRPKRTIINYVFITFLSLLPAGKVADNHECD